MADNTQMDFGNAGLMEKPLEAEGESQPLPDVDAKVKLFFDEGDMRAEAQVTPPQGAGAPVSREMLDAALAQAGARANHLHRIKLTRSILRGL